MEKKVLLVILSFLIFVTCMATPGVYAADVIDVTYGSTPTVDGTISPGEYADANSVTFATKGGTCTVYFKHNGQDHMYVAFDVPNKDAGSAVQVFVDTENDKASAPQTDDWRFSINWDATHQGCYCGQNQGTGTDWGGMTDCDPHGQPCGWSGYWQTQASAWTAEFGIPYTKLGITAGKPDTIGISFWNAWTLTGDYNWPTGADWDDPSTWGTAYSTDYWIAPVGGISGLVDKFGLLAPYIGLASAIVVATAATAIYVKRDRRKEEKR